MTPSERRRTSAARGPSPHGDDAQLERTRRLVYATVCGVGTLTSAGIWMLNFGQPVPDPATLYTTPLFTALAVWGAWWLATGRSIEVINRVSLAVCGGVIVARGILTPLLGSSDLLSSMQDLYWLLVLMSILAFLTLGHRQAVRLTAGFYAASVAGPWTALALAGSVLATPARLGQVQLLCAVVLLSVFSLAWYREHYQRGQEELRLTHRLALTDALTGLHNRHALYPRLETMLDGPTDPDGVCGSVLLIDIDHFKQINDTHGHTVGDDVLRRVAGQLFAELREQDILGRWGGEEFLAGLPGADGADVLVIAERLRRSVQALPLDLGWDVTISIGVTPVRRGEPLQNCVARADAALYHAKGQGRNRVQVYEMTPEAAPGFHPGLTPGA